MTVMVMIAAGVCALSIAIGFTARHALGRPPLPGPEPAGAGPAALAPDRWGPLARALLRPDSYTAWLAIWLAILDVALALAAPWPLKVVVDYALGGHRFPPSLAWLGRLTPWRSP